MNLTNYFHRTYAISLKRRPERWAGLLSSLQSCGWPFLLPNRYDAIDGKLCKPPAWWHQGGGAWGCYRSHLNILETCLNDQVESVLILEDDAIPVPDFAKRVQAFLKDVPDDWDMLYLGGQHLFQNRNPPITVNSEVVQVYNVNRTHAYAVRGKMLPILYNYLLPKEWRKGQHIDHHFGHLHQKREHHVYAPTEWLIGQNQGKSNISGKTNPIRYWNGTDTPQQPKNKMNQSKLPNFVAVLGLHSSGSSCLAGVLHHLGLHMGNKFGGYYGSDPEKNCGFEAVGLMHICESAIPFPKTVRPQPGITVGKQLKDWIQQRRQEAKRRGNIAGGKYPQLCQLGPELIDACGSDLRLIAIDRPISESIQSMHKRFGSHYTREQIAAHQEWLQQGKEELLAQNIPHLRILYHELLQNPSREISRICKFLNWQAQPTQVTNATNWVKPELRHIRHQVEETPSEVIKTMTKMIDQGKYWINIASCDGTEVHMQRWSKEFPIDQLAKLEDLILNDIQTEQRQLTTPTP